MEFSLSHDAWGRLVLTDAAGVEHVGVDPVRAFPISEPQRSVSILDAQGHELHWIANMDEVPVETRHVLEAELAKRHFLPVVRRIRSIAGATEPTEWDIETDRGNTKFKLKSEEDVRRVAGHRVIIVDAHGVRYLLPDLRALDASSRRLLERYI